MTHPVDTHVGLRIRARRKMLGVSQEALAEALGLTFQQVQKYEGGFNRISASKLKETADVLGCKVGWFFEGLGRAQAEDGPDQLLTRFAGVIGGFSLAEVFVELSPERQQVVLAVARAMQRERS